MAKLCLIKSYFSDEHISTFNSSPESRRPHSSESVRLHHLASLLSKCSKQFQPLKHRFKQRQNAPFSFLRFKFKQFELPNHRSNSVRMHQLASLRSTCSAVPTSKPLFQIAPECIVYVLAFNIFSAVPTSRTSFQIASECTIHRP